MILDFIVPSHSVPVVAATGRILRRSLIVDRGLRPGQFCMILSAVAYTVIQNLRLQTCLVASKHTSAAAVLQVIVTNTIIIIIYPLTARGTTDDFATSFLHFPPVLLCPLGLGELQVCPFPDVVFPPLSLSALSSFPFHCALQVCQT